MDVPRLVRLQRAHHYRLAAIQQNAFDLVGAAWDRYGGLDDTALRAFAEAAAVIVDASKAQVATVTAGYIAANDLAAVGEVVPVIPAPPVIRGGIPTAEVYARSVVESRVRIAAGATFDEAMSAGRARATGTAITDVNLTNKATIDRVAPLRPWVVGYRRILTGRSCAICAAASTQRYRRPNLMPIHQRCDCDVGEIYGTADPGRVINRDLYRDLREEGIIGDIGEQRRDARRRAEGEDVPTRTTPGGRPASFYVDDRGGIFRADGTPVRARTVNNPEVGPLLVAA